MQVLKHRPGLGAHALGLWQAGHWGRERGVEGEVPLEVAPQVVVAGQNDVDLLCMGLGSKQRGKGREKGSGVCFKRMRL